VTFVSSKTATGSYHAGTGDWTVGSLPAKQIETLRIVATVDAGTAGRTIHNTASVTQVNLCNDPVVANDADTAPITVAKVGPAGGTSFTGFPGTWPFVAWFVLMVLGLASLAGSRRRRA